MSKANIAIHAQDKTGRAISSAKNNLASLQKRVGLVSSSFVKMIGVAGISALGVLTKRTIDSADNLSKLRDRLGASTEALSQYKHVAELSNVSFDTLTMGWQRMTRRVAEAAQGTGEAKNALRELGISAVELNKLKPEQQFEVLADAIKSVENPADKVRLAMKLFDSEGVSLIQTMKGGSEGIREMRDEADRLGKTITDDMAQGAADANDAMTRLGASISGSVTQSILTYTDEIKYAADMTAEYLPKAIGFLMDIFKGLKATVEFTVSIIISRLESFFSALSKIPKIGEKFEGIRDSLIDAGLAMDDQFNSTVAGMGKWKDSAVDVEKQSRKVADSFDGTSGSLKLSSAEMYKHSAAAKDAQKNLDNAAKATSKLAAEQDKLIAEYRESVSIYGEYADANELVYDKLLDVTKEEKRRKGILREVTNLVADGSFTQDQANKILAETGVLTEEVTDKQKDLGSTVTTVRGLWERANDSMFNSLQTFFSSGLKDTANFADSFKDTFTDMISSVLAEITRLIASNAFKKFLGLMGVGGSANQGVGIFDGIGAMFGGVGDSGGVPGIGSAASGAGALFSGLGGGASGTSGIAGIGRLLMGGGNVSAAGPVVPTAGVFGSAGTAISQAAAALKTGATKLLGAIPVWGQVALAAVAVRALIGSGARSPQQLGLDQLQSVSDATKAGRNTQVQLGSVAGVGTSFLGGFDENSTFFGVDLVKEELQKVGDILANKFGFNQALALKDGVIRLEDFSRDFSENNERIVAEVQASILIAKKGFEDAELAKVAALGRSVIAMDRLYDQSASSGLSAADRLKQAYMGAFGESESAAITALDNMGLSTEKLAEIFDSSSNEILATLTGVSTEGLGLFGEGLAKVGEQASATFDSIENRINAAAQSARVGANAIGSSFDGALSRSRNNLERLTEEVLMELKDVSQNQNANRAQNQQLFGT